MRIVPSRKVLLLVGLLGCNVMFAAPDPPPPIPPPPGFPIDGWITFVVFLSLVFGLYKIYRIKKASN
ncbi:hypothetical protein [Flavobacterium sp.]|uniref:hypothetical protein n=1 Tax=Flavobacterium sp. TaxID=239 RepID=UPI00261BD6A9|nr:hypothetical protein [Flavobacterium sp.]